MPGTHRLAVSLASVSLHIVVLKLFNYRNLSLQILNSLLKVCVKFCVKLAISQKLRFRRVFIDVFLIEKKCIINASRCINNYNVSFMGGQDHAYAPEKYRIPGLIPNSDFFAFK